MKFKMHVAGALLAALFSAQAAATINTGISPGPGQDGNGELFLTITDIDPTGTTGRSYTRDLGIRMNAFLPTPAGSGVTAKGYTLEFAPDALLTSFLAQSEPARQSMFVWNIGALDNNQQNRYLTTAKSIDPSQIPTNLALRTFDDNTSSYLANVNTLPTHPGGDAINGSSTATEADGPAYGGSALWGNNWGGSATFNSTARIGESMNFYLLANTSNSGSNALKANLTIFANDVGNASWSLAQDGTLTYMAPVPEPGEWALMLSGLALVGALARRRNRGARS
jgi:hypothetical protein